MSILLLKNVSIDLEKCFISLKFLPFLFCFVLTFMVMWVQAEVFNY